MFKILEMFIKKNRVMSILQTQSVTLLFLCFYYPHELKSRNTCNRKYLYIMTCLHRKK